MSIGPFKIRNKIFLKNAAGDSYGVTLENDTITSANKTFRYPNTDVTSFTGTGALVLGTSPSLTTPTLGAANATSLKPTTAAAFNFFLNDGSTNIGNYSTAGAWTLGPSSNTPYTSYHSTYKSIFSPALAGTNLYGTFKIGTNSYGASGYQPTRQTGLTGSEIVFLNTTSDAVDCLRINTSKQGDSATTVSTTVASVLPTGAWTLGASDGTSAAHILYGGAAIKFGINGTEYAASTLLIDQNGGDSRFFSCGADGTTKGSYSFYGTASDGAPNDLHGSISNVGAWTLGPVAAIQHTINGGVTPVKLVPNSGTVAGVSLNDYGVIEAGSGLAARFRVTDSTRTPTYGNCDTNGSWTLGASSTYTTSTKVLQINGNIASASPGGSYDGSIDLYLGHSTNSQSAIKSFSNEYAAIGSKLSFFTTTIAGALTEKGSIDKAGAWSMPLLGSGAGTYALKWTTTSGLLTYDTSHRASKLNIRDSHYGLADILKMRSVEFEYIADNRPDVGFVADEMFEIIPELTPMIEEDFILKNGNKELVPGGVSYDRLTSVLVKAIQELNAKIEALEAKCR